MYMHIRAVVEILLYELERLGWILKEWCPSSVEEHSLASVVYQYKAHSYLTSILEQIYNDCQFPGAHRVLVYGTMPTRTLYVHSLLTASYGQANIVYLEIYCDWVYLNI
jgi:hypothetical protein